MNFIANYFKNRRKDGKEFYNKLNIDEKDMIKGVIELSKKTVKDVLLPRIDAIFLPVKISRQELLKKIIDSGHSRFPVYEDDIDNVIGILYVKDLVKFLIKDEKIKIREIIRKPYFVPESKKLDSLLKEFKKRRVHISVAVDEFGGVSGIVCLEDVIEEIIGDIQDEFDNETEDLIKIGDDIYLCEARIGLTELNQKLKLSIPEDEFETLGGFILSLFDRIPVKYEKAVYKNIEFIIQDLKGHQIKQIKIIKKPEGKNE